MRRISAYFISLLFLITASNLRAQDTIPFPLFVRAGFDLVGPGIYIYDNQKLNLEGYLSFDKSEKLTFVLEGGYTDYNYSQYNYDYHSHGVFTRIGADFNLLKPGLSKGKYWSGIGLRYGLSFYTSETPMFQNENYWGQVTSSIPPDKSTGHFIELTPGFRTEIFKYFTVGWTVRVKLLLSGGGTKDIKPIYLPGYGNSGKMTGLGISYYISFNLPYKTKTVITKPEVAEEPAEEEETGQQTTGSGQR